MNTTTTNIEPRRGILALAVTSTIHIVVAAGIIWGNWLGVESARLHSKASEILVAVDISDTIPAQPNKTMIPAEKKDKKAPEPEKPEAIQKPNIFVPVNPESTTPDPPKKNTPFYSNANTKAANEKPEKRNQKQPFIDGENELFPGTFNNDNSALNPTPKSTASRPAQLATLPRPLPLNKLRPQEAAKVPHDQIPLNQNPLPQAKKEQNALRKIILPKNIPSGLFPLEVEAANNSLVPVLPNSLKRVRIPTVTEQKRRLEAGMLASRKMKQQGGSNHVGAPNLDVRLTGYGDYDARFVQAVRLAWLRFRNKPGWFHPGKVVIDFNLHHDGTITELVISQNLARTVQSYFCREALAGPAPFEKWTETMRREIGADVRSCRFSFHYLLR
jgi:hypothetical protein|tara:strand:- start:1115 stop:2275 length:1161 start_codon:yes stop_codon:yes gene_type:complete